MTEAQRFAGRGPFVLSRRMLMAGGLALLAPVSGQAAPPAGKTLAFAVFRNGTRIGDHQMSFAGDPASPTVTTDVRMLVKLGPVPVYRYGHHAVERWSGGRFASLETRTDGNGKLQTVSARRTPENVVIETGTGRLMAPAAAAPFTHWNPEVFAGPLFNPQEGVMLKVQAVRKGKSAVRLADGRSVQASLWAVRGAADIDDWYDDAGVWTALRGKLKDGSTMEYRRI